ncbi:hypothetical protein ScPMuIL_014290 [Solemya velum]
MDPIAEDEESIEKPGENGSTHEKIAGGDSGEDIATSSEEGNGEEEEEEDFDNVSKLYRERAVTPNQEEQFDTDLENEEENGVYDPTGRRAYLLACKKLGSIPVSYFLRHMQDEVLSMCHHGLGSQGVAALAHALQNNTCVLTLDLSDNWLEGEGGEHIAEMLKENCYITDLNISDNKLGSRGMAAISKMLQDNNSLRSIILSGNEFSDQDASHVAAAMNENVQLVELNLSNNNFGEKAGEILGASLGENETLEELDLSWNAFRQSGAVQLCKGITVNTRLRKLDLSMNGLGNEGAIAIADVIKQNNALQEIYISYNRIGNSGAMALGKALETNETLKVLKLDHNPIGIEGVTAILQGIYPANSVVSDLDLSAVEIDKETRSLYKEIQASRSVTVRHGPVIGDYNLKWKPKKRFPEGQLFMVPIEKVTQATLMSVIAKYSEDYSAPVLEALVSLDTENVGRVGKATFMEALKVAEIRFTDDQKEALDNIVDTLFTEETLDYSPLKQN